MTISLLQEQALSVLQIYVDRRAAIDAANETIHEAVASLGDDFSGLHLNSMEGRVLDAFCGLLDAIWGMPNAGLAGYYLHECIGPRGHGGGVVCCSKKQWKLRNIGELRAYLEHCQVCEWPVDRQTRGGDPRKLPADFGGVPS